MRYPDFLPIYYRLFTGRHVRDLKTSLKRSRQGSHECIINCPISDSSTNSNRDDKHVRIGTHPRDTECIHIDH